MTDSKDIKKVFKLFTFSKLKFFPHNRTKYGFENVREIEFDFATPVKKSFEHLVLGIFSNSEIILNFKNINTKFNIQNVETLKEPNISGKEKFICLSPICTSTVRIKNNKKEQHFLNYMDPKERTKFIQNIKNNLIEKYKTYYGKEYEGKTDFQFSFEPEYIVKKNGRISKLITFKNDIKIKAMEAPFTISANPKLIKIGYECGFGEKNSAGFGMVGKI
ncbi:MAG: CRISPR-associated endoribonuclease Cas6 [Candidatus Marinimicrobia bacterium]|nr:CRISPR-associated endoribonuclease Cas6 [Candidatus Neomarinimicrobiota bacterium]